MRVLLVHPDDNFNGSWKSRRWDLVIDLGRAPKSFYTEPSTAFGCPVASVFDLAVEVEDLRVWRGLLQLGMGQVVDAAGIDWWDVIALLLQPELQQVRLSLRWAERLHDCHELAATRESLTAKVLSSQLAVPLQVFPRSTSTRLADAAARRAKAVANLGWIQLRQVLYDKYDPQYRWRRLMASPLRWAEENPGLKSDARVLLPSAYSNVTKTALAYADVLPEQKFLLALARESAFATPVPPNVEVVHLSSFARQNGSPGEFRELAERWRSLQRSLSNHPAFRLPIELGILNKGLDWLRWTLPIRDAWLRLFDQRPIIACLSADDTNPYTRIPLILAAHRGMPAVSCHHGALDCAMSFKPLRSSSYLAKGEMEHDYLTRLCEVDPAPIHVGPPPVQAVNERLWSDSAPYIAFFTEPYETDSWRVEAIYRDLLPRLCGAARSAGKSVLLKLHPFESARQRRQQVRRTLNQADRRLVTVTDAPLSQAILQRTWCAVTVESTTALQCAVAGIPSFLCGWLRHAYAGYAPQFAKFGAGRLLEGPDDLLRIPELLLITKPVFGVAGSLLSPINPVELARLIEPHPATLRLDESGGRVASKAESQSAAAQSVSSRSATVKAPR